MLKTNKTVQSDRDELQLDINFSAISLDIEQLTIEPLEPRINLMSCNWASGRDCIRPMGHKGLHDVVSY